MANPPLYKFLDRRGARLTLGNGTFRHAKPSSFNDLEDLTIQSVFPERIEDALERLAKGFPDVILRNLDSEPTCSPDMQMMIRAIQSTFKANPRAVEASRSAFSHEEVYDVGAMRTKSEKFIDEINQFMQGFRILCVTPAIESKLMWERYAEQEQGIALRIEANVSKDSKFQLFRPVTYADTRPPIYKDTLQFLEESLFRDRMERYAEILETIIFTKTREWEYEQEYRLAIPLAQGEEPWDTLPYHPEEITELHLGPKMPKADQEEIVELGRKLNPDILIIKLT